MMKYLFPALLCCVSSISTLHAEEKSAAMKVTPFGNLLLEVALTDKWVTGFDVTINNMSMVMWRDNIYSASSMGIRSSWHKHGAFEQGAYASLYVDHILFEYDSWNYNWAANGNQTGSGSTQAIGFISGYQWLWDDSLSLNLGGGYGFVLPTSIEANETIPTYDRLGNVVKTQDSNSSIDIPSNSSFVLDFYIGFVF